MLTLPLTLSMNPNTNPNHLQVVSDKIQEGRKMIVCVCVHVCVCVFHKSKLHIIYINLLPNSVFEDPFHHFQYVAND